MNFSEWKLRHTLAFIVIPFCILTVYYTVDEAWAKLTGKDAS